jgi:hypothetical protein
MPVKIKISVTQAHIAAGRTALGMKSMNCPVAQAVNTHYGRLPMLKEGASVSGDDVYVPGRGDFHLDDAAKLFIRRFDEGSLVAPFEFEMWSM